MSLFFMPFLLYRPDGRRTLNAQGRSSVDGPIAGDPELLPEDRANALGEVVAKRVRRALLHVKALRHLELHRVDRSRRIPQSARDVAPLEAAIQDRRIASMAGQRGEERGRQLRIA